MQSRRSNSSLPGPLPCNALYALDLIEAPSHCCYSPRPVAFQLFPVEAYNMWFEVRLLHVPDVALDGRPGAPAGSDSAFPYDPLPNCLPQVSAAHRSTALSPPPPRSRASTQRPPGSRRPQSPRHDRSPPPLECGSPPGAAPTAPRRPRSRARRRRRASSPWRWLPWPRCCSSWTAPPPCCVASTTPSSSGPSASSATAGIPAAPPAAARPPPLRSPSAWCGALHWVRWRCSAPPSSSHSHLIDPYPGWPPHPPTHPPTHPPSHHHHT